MPYALSVATSVARRLVMRSILLSYTERAAVLSVVVIADSFDLVYEVNQRVSGDQAALIVEREGEQINLDVTFAPLPKTDEHGMGKHKK